MKVIWSLFLVMSLCATVAIAEDSAAKIWESDTETPQAAQSDVIATEEDFGPKGVDAAEPEDDAAALEDEVD